jgi:hypothetical protein
MMVLGVVLILIMIVPCSGRDGRSAGSEAPAVRTERRPERRRRGAALAGDGGVRPVPAAFYRKRIRESDGRAETGG